MMRLSTGCIIEQGHLSITQVVLDVLGGVVEANIVEATGSAKRAPVHVVFAPLQPCSMMHTLQQHTMHAFVRVVVMYIRNTCWLRMQSQPHNIHCCSVDLINAVLTQGSNLRHTAQTASSSLMQHHRACRQHACKVADYVIDHMKTSDAHPCRCKCRAINLNAIWERMQFGEACSSTQQTALRGGKTQ